MIDREARRALVEGSAELDGIDFVEVLSNHRGTPGHVAGAPSQRTLLVHLLNRAVPDPAHVDITGGVRPDPRINPVGVLWAYPAVAVAGAAGTAPTGGLAGVGAADRALVDAALPATASAREKVLVVRTTSSGDWSTYTLHLQADGLDEPLASCPFTFTVDCPSDLDCATPDEPPPQVADAPVLDYLARDYDALRSRLLDRLSALLPGWSDRSPADPGVMLAELFAHLGDRLAYWQDAVGREAYLGTAVQRTSVRRHARLLDYPVHEGCSARVWLAVTTDVPADLAAGAAVTTAGPTLPDDLPITAHENGAAVFQTCRDVHLDPARNGLDLHTWGDPDHVLPAGARTAYLAAGDDPGLAAGDVLLLVDCPHPRPADLAFGDPAARFAVRLDRDPVAHTDPLAPGVTVLEVHWSPPLPAPLRAAEPGPDGRPAVRAVALANVVPADHGATVLDEPLVPPQTTAGQAYRPRLARTGLAYADPVGQDRLTPPDPRRAQAQVELDDGHRTWTPRPDLIGSGRLDTCFVVEPDGPVARLRFGDGVTGRRPSGVFRARYRLGGGVAGNVAAGRLTRWLSRPDGSPAGPGGAALSVWNPLPATGGTDPEAVARVRTLAPTAFRTQLRVVTAADHADAAQTVPGVQRAVSRRVWTGSWYAMATTIDPRADSADDPAVPAGVTTLLRARRMAGTDVEVVGPVYVPLHIGVFACLDRGFDAAEVRAQLLDVLSARDLPAGQGFFHPDRFTFGQPLYLSDLVAAVMGVPGIATVDITVFEELGRPTTAANLSSGRITVGPRQVLRCDSDPNNPEAGRVDIALGGGS